VSQKACLFASVNILATIAGIFQYLGELLDTIPVFVGRRNDSHGRKDPGICVQTRQNLSDHPLNFLFSFARSRRYHSQNY
jgi:hypothetical protein